MGGGGVDGRRLTFKKSCDGLGVKRGSERREPSRGEERYEGRGGGEAAKREEEEEVGRGCREGLE